MKIHNSGGKYDKKIQVIRNNLDQVKVIQLILTKFLSA
jgi:hypothetical protein